MQTIITQIENFYKFETNYSNIEVAIDEKSILVSHSKGQGQILIPGNCIAVNKKQIAWLEYQSSLDYLVVIGNLNGNDYWQWVPEGRMDWDGFEFFAFSWVDEYLFVIYRGKHEFFVCSLQKGKFPFIAIHGDALKVFKDFMTFKKYGDATVYKMNVPELQITDRLTSEEANELGVKPESQMLDVLEFNFYELKNCF